MGPKQLELLEQLRRFSPRAIKVYDVPTRRLMGRLINAGYAEFVVGGSYRITKAGMDRLADRLLWGKR